MSGQPDMFGAPDVGGERDATDRYFTPPWATHALCHYLGGRLSGDVWEPAAGNGAIVDIVRAHEGVDGVTATDIVPGREDVGTFGFLGPYLKAVGPPNWIITNPPYNAPSGTATEFVRNPPTDVLVLPRVHYLGAPGSNNQTSAWFIWSGPGFRDGSSKLTVYDAEQCRQWGRM